MEFTSINEYFYKFNSVLLVMMLIPIVGFIALYLQLSEVISKQFDPTNSIVTATAVVLVWLLVFVFFNKKIKSIRNAQGLRQKLEKYFQLTIVRFSVFACCAIGLLGVFYETRNDLITLIFVAQLVICGFVWPTSSKASRDLKLRGDEREMVYYRKDVL
jgi:hypothetical protein